MNTENNTQTKASSVLNINLEQKMFLKNCFGFSDLDITEISKF
ncbi:MAG: hypothetical protein RL208_333, partial [Pseudomonadota bacterium]